MGYPSYFAPGVSAPISTTTALCRCYCVLYSKRFYICSAFRFPIVLIERCSGFFSFIVARTFSFAPKLKARLLGILQWPLLFFFYPCFFSRHSFFEGNLFGEES